MPPEKPHMEDFSRNVVSKTRRLAPPRIETMLFECWSTVCDDGSTLTQYWVSDSGFCFLVQYHLFLLVVVQMKA